MAKKSGTFLLILFWIVMMFMGTFAMPTMLIIMAAMIPTFVAWLTDTEAGKYSAFCVGAFNICGTIPFLVELWTGKHSLMQAGVILRDPNTWLVMYGAAAVGWLFYFIAPVFAVVYITVRDDRQTQLVKAELANLEKEWGAEIKPAPEKEEQSKDKKV